MASPLDLSEDQRDKLRRVADAIAAPGKRVLVADENTGTMGKLLADIGVENIKDNRCKYWQFLFTEDESTESLIKGVTLFHKTVFQKTDDEPFVIPSSFQNNGVIPGIEIEKNIVPLMETEGESTNTTEDLNNLAERCQEYKRLGCQFVNWHCILKITSNTSFSLAIQNLAKLLALWSSTCQQKCLVPILHPEILWDSDPDEVETQKTTEDTLSAVYEALSKHHVYLEGTLLKLNIVTAGQSFNEKYTLEDAAKATMTALRKTVPQSVPGVFVSGGHSEEEAIAYWNAIHKHASRSPWALSFISDPIVQASVLKLAKAEMRLGKTESSTFAEKPYWRVDYAPAISCLLEEIPNLFKRAKTFMEYPENYKVREEFIHEHRDIYATELNRGKKIGVQTFENSAIATNSEHESSIEKKAKKIQNLSNAVNYMFGRYLYVTTLRHQFNADLAKELNKIIGEGLFDNAGSYRKLYAKPALEDFFYLPPLQIEENMKRLFTEVNEDLGSKKWFETAGNFFAKFLLIHPFSNGNGRTARVLLSALLIKYAIVPVCLFSSVGKNNSNEIYLDCVRQAQKYKNYSLLYSLIIENTHFGLHNFLKRF